MPSPLSGVRVGRFTVVDVPQLIDEAGLEAEEQPSHSIEAEEQPSHSIMGGLETIYKSPSDVHPLLLHGATGRQPFGEWRYELQ
jgi:hypothetical protein